MKALVKFASGMQGIELRDVEQPRPRANELLVKVMAAGICGTDVHIAHDEYPCSPQVTLGHEYTGIVAEVGSEAKGFAVGNQVVSLTAVVTCGGCRFCRRGLLMLCSQRRSIGSGVNGAMAEYLVVPHELAYVVPPEIADSDLMALGEPLACAVRAVIERSRLKAGDVALVSGPGTIGQLTALVAKAQGARVIMAGTAADAARLEFALTLGVDAIAAAPEQLTEAIARLAPEGVDVAYECAGAAASLQACIEAVAKTGNLVQVGLYGRPITVHMDQLLIKEVDLTLSFGTAPTSWEIMLRMAAAGGFPGLDRLITGRVPLADWRRGFDMMIDRVGFKTLLVP